MRSCQAGPTRLNPSRCDRDWSLVWHIEDVTIPTSRRQSNPIQRVSLTDSIAKELSTRILNGEIEPGANLREVELSQDLAVSRQSLRAALAQLNGSGLLRHEMNRGYWVPIVTRADAMDIFQLRELIEGEAARRLTQQLDRITPVLDALDAIENLSDNVSWVDYLEIHFAFHRAIVKTTESPRLVRHFEMLSAETWVSLVPSHLSSEFGTPTAQRAGHRHVVEVIQEGDPNRALEVVRDHLWSGFDDLYPE
jgi:DNA-binding GntR family transcriptional regulator